MPNKNTNEGSFSQMLLGTHRPNTNIYDPSKMTPEAIENAKKDRRLRARMKMVDMTPAQKKAELKRLKAKKKKREKLKLSNKPSLRNP